MLVLKKINDLFNLIANLKSNFRKIIGFSNGKKNGRKHLSITFWSFSRPFPGLI